MIRNPVPGDIVRVADRTIYEPLAKLMRARQTEAGFVIEKIIETRSYGQGRGEYVYTIQVRYPDGSLSGALYVDLFEKMAP